MRLGGAVAPQFILVYILKEALRSLAKFARLNGCQVRLIGYMVKKLFFVPSSIPSFVSSFLLFLLLLLACSSGFPSLKFLSNLLVESFIAPFVCSLTLVLFCSSLGTLLFHLFFPRSFIHEMFGSTSRCTRLRPLVYFSFLAESIYQVFHLFILW